MGVNSSVVLASLPEGERRYACHSLYLVLFLYIYAVIVSFVAYVEPFYVIRPHSCDAAVYDNFTSFGLLDDWMLTTHGACPSHRMSNASISTTIDINSTRQHGYDRCLDFKLSSSLDEWRQIDHHNNARGVPTQLMTDARAWSGASDNVLSASMFLLFGLQCWLFVVGCCLEVKHIRSVIFGSSFCLFLGFLLWISSLGSMAGTDQLKPEAWSTYFFAGCSVDVVNSTGVTIGSLIVVVSMLILILMTCLTCILRRNNIFAQPYTNNNTYDPYNPYETNNMLHLQPGEAIMSPMVVVPPYGNGSYATVVHIPHQQTFNSTGAGYTPQQPMGMVPVYAVQMNPIAINLGTGTASIAPSDYELGLYPNLTGGHQIAYPFTGGAGVDYPQSLYPTSTGPYPYPGGYYPNTSAVAVVVPPNYIMSSVSSSSAAVTPPANTSESNNTSASTTSGTVAAATAISSTGESRLEGAIVGSDFYYHPSMFAETPADHIPATVVPAVVPEEATNLVPPTGNPPPMLPLPTTGTSICGHQSQPGQNDAM